MPALLAYTLQERGSRALGKPSKHCTDQAISPAQTDFFFKHLRIYQGGGAIEPMWRSEDTFWDLVLSFHCVDRKDQTGLSVADLILNTQTRLALNSRRSVCLYLLTAGIKGLCHYCPAGSSTLFELFQITSFYSSQEAEKKTFLLDFTII